MRDVWDSAFATYRVPIAFMAGIFVGLLGETYRANKNR